MNTPEELVRYILSDEPSKKQKPKILLHYDMPTIRRICDKTAELYFKGIEYHEAFAMAKRIEGWR